MMPKTDAQTAGWMLVIVEFAFDVDGATEGAQPLPKKMEC
jgi:hypothetical protein